MRILNARILGSVSFSALAIAAFPAAAFAQADAEAAQPQTTVSCQDIPNEVDRQNCLAELAQNQPGPQSLPEGGAPGEAIAVGQ